MASHITSSVIQPAFGYLSDRRPMGWFLPLTPSSPVSGIPFRPDAELCPHPPLRYWGGHRVASFHPEAFKTTYFFTGEKKATGMSFFMVGGNAGVALGPIFGIGLVTSFGLKGTLGFLLPGIIFSAILSLSVPGSPTGSLCLRRGQERGKQPLQKHEILGLLILIGMLVTRSWIQSGLVTYIPFYHIDYLKGDPLYAGKLSRPFCWQVSWARSSGDRSQTALGRRRSCSGPWR